MQTGPATLAADLRVTVGAVILVAQGKTVFFRADPSGLVYRGTPDSIGVTTARRIGLQLLRAFQPPRGGV